MATLKVKRGSGTPTGLTAWELAYDHTNGKFYIGNTTGSPVLLGSSGGGVASITGTGAGISVSPTTGAVVVQNLGVLSVVGITGNVGISAGIGITTSISGQTLTISQVVGNTNGNATYYPGFYGITNGIATPYTDSTLQYNASTNTFSGYGGLVLKGVSAGGAGNQNYINLKDPNNGGIEATSANGTFRVSNYVGSLGNNGSIILDGFDSLDNVFDAKIIPASPFTSAVTYTLPSVSTATVTFGLLETTQTFTGLKNFSSGIGVTGGTYYGTQTFVNGATFSARANFSAGISCSGATFNSLATFNAGLTATSITGGICTVDYYRISSVPLETKTAGFTLAAVDNGKIFLMGNTANAIVYFPTGLPVGFKCDFIRRATGSRIRFFQSGTTIESKSGTSPEMIDNGFNGEQTSAIQVATNVFAIYGDLL